MVNKGDFKMMDFIESIWYKIETKFEAWIYPGYFTRNLLFNRYDLIKIPGVKPWECVDVSIKMRYAIFELIKNFVEKENGIESLTWEEHGSCILTGPKYGEHNTVIIYPELKDKFIAELLKEIYDFYTKEWPQIEKESDYLLMVWSHYVSEVRIENNVLVKGKSPYTLESPVIKELNWDILLKYIEEKDNLFKSNIVHDVYTNTQKELSKKIKYYMHLAVEIYEYLWI